MTDEERALLEAVAARTGTPLGQLRRGLIPGVAVDLRAARGFGWSCQCGGRDKVDLLWGCDADFTVRCGGCGRVFRARLEEVTA